MLRSRWWKTCGSLGLAGLGLAGWAHAQSPSGASTVATAAPTATSRQPNALLSTGNGAPVRHLSVVDPKWRDSLDAFAKADQEKLPPPGGVLFLGSSSIRLWADLEKQFGELPIVVKRGFGGSRLADSARYADRLVLPYKPRLIIVYAGDNDLAEGATPQQVLASMQELVTNVRAELPATRLAYVSIKPSPLRLALLPNIQETNRLIREYTSKTPNLDYIDVFSKMLDSTGLPRADLYLADQLHLNAEGYALWRREIANHIDGSVVPRDVAKAKAEALITADTLRK